MKPSVESATRRIRVVAALLIVGLAAGPVSTHVYWMLGGTWGLYTDGVRDELASTGTRVVAAVVVLARVGLWRQALVSERAIRLFAWLLAAVFLLESLAALTWNRGEWGWWMYGPVSLLIAVLALIVAGSGGAWRPDHRPHRTRPSH